MMKLFNLLLSPIGRVASRPMRNIVTFPSKQMYLYLSLVEERQHSSIIILMEGAIWFGRTYCHHYLERSRAVLGG